MRGRAATFDPITDSKSLHATAGSFEPLCRCKSHAPRGVQGSLNLCPYRDDLVHASLSPWRLPRSNLECHKDIYKTTCHNVAGVTCMLAAFGYISPRLTITSDEAPKDCRLHWTHRWAENKGGLVWTESLLCSAPRCCKGLFVSSSGGGVPRLNDVANAMR